jgi:stage III sporulation protein AG
MDEKSSGIKKLFESDKIRKIIIIIGAIGIALIFVSSFTGINTGGKEETGGFSVTTYSTEIESDLQKILSSISGCGETKVLLTIENSVEYVYIEDSTTKTKEIQPVIRGVLVVCEGGDDPVVAQTVTQAVTRALDISSAKVCVTKLTERR